jgi:hypothetical protein
MKNIIKKVLFALIFIFLIFWLLILSNFTYTSFLNKLFVENSNEKVREIFTVDKIVFFSSCSATSNINSNTTTTINNLSQYTDIAIFINNDNNELSLENTFKSVSIKDISFYSTPNLGTPKLYYKSLTSFATPNIVEDNLIDSSLDFSVSSEDEIDYNNPILFNNCANPITLGYVNTNVIDNYTVDNASSSISYDGSLLKKCNVLLNDINCSFSFTIYIENNLGQKFRCPIYITIPFENTSSSIYDGSYTYIYNPNYVFYTY